MAHIAASVILDVILSDLPEMIYSDDTLSKPAPVETESVLVLVPRDYGVIGVRSFSSSYCVSCPEPP